MKPDLAIISEQENKGILAVTVDTHKATYRQTKWKEMGDFGKRKFENFLVLKYPKNKVRVIYA